MCQPLLPALDPIRMRDYIRGRYAHPERFDKIQRFAQKRWEHTKNLRHSRRWYGVIESVETRRK